MQISNLLQMPGNLLKDADGILVPVALAIVIKKVKFAAIQYAAKYGPFLWYLF